MTARAEVSGLAGAGRQTVITTLIALEPGIAMMQISTGEEALEAFGVERPMGKAGGIGFRAMAASTLIGGAGLWVARTVYAARW